MKNKNHNWRLVPGLGCLLVCCLLAPSAVWADAPDKARDLTKARQEERERAAEGIPILPAAEMYRRHFALMKAGQFEKAGMSYSEEALRQMKKALIAALRTGSLEDRAQVVKGGHFASAAELQRAVPERVFGGWLLSGWRVKNFLQHLQQSEIVSIKETIRDRLCELAVELKTTVDGKETVTKETIPCQLQDRVWRLTTELSLE